MPVAASTPHAGDGEVSPDFAAVLGKVLCVAMAWIALFDAELALAARSLRALLLTALVAPIMAVGFWISVLFLLMSGLHAAGCNWPTSAGITSVAQLFALLWLVRAMRRWARDLTFRRSRELIVRAASDKPR